MTRKRPVWNWDSPHSSSLHPSFGIRRRRNYLGARFLFFCPSWLCSSFKVLLKVLALHLTLLPSLSLAPLFLKLGCLINHFGVLSHFIILIQNLICLFQSLTYEIRSVLTFCVMSKCEKYVTFKVMMESSEYSKKSLPGEFATRHACNLQL